MRFPRSSGILLHVTSLPGTGPIGDLGEEGYRFVDFLEESGQALWEILPLSPLGYGNSPYSSPSAFAVNPLLLSMEALEKDGWLSRNDLPARASASAVDFSSATPSPAPRSISPGSPFSRGGGRTGRPSRSSAAATPTGSRTTPSSSP